MCSSQPSPSPLAATSLGLFPAGRQQARVQLPAVVIQLEAQQVLADPSVLESLGEALRGGCNAVVLWDETNAGAAVLYDAALRIQEVLRGRAALLLVDRTDIATAVAAEGVVLTDQGERRGGAGGAGGKKGEGGGGGEGGGPGPSQGHGGAGFVHTGF